MSLPYKIMNTIKQYENLLKIEEIEKRKDYFRYEMMRPYKEMWNILNVPLKAKEPNGYDVMMATEMLGYANISNEKHLKEGLNSLKNCQVLQTAEKTLKNCIERTEERALKIQVDELILGIYVANPFKLKLQKGYTGFGGIPGYITVNIYPNEYNIEKIPAIIAHEFHHNLRFSYFDWDHGNITVGDYIVIEGLAESFAKELYGAEQLGPWVTSMDKGDLAYSTNVIGDALDVRGFSEVSSYMFGDDIAKENGYQPVGLSFCAGYAVGYEVVQSYMKRNDKSIFETTLIPSKDIIEGSGIFST